MSALNSVLFSLPAVALVSAMFGISAPAAVKPDCCLENAPCCVVGAECCAPAPSAVARTVQQAETNAVDQPAKPTCCYKRAYCCSIGRSCCSATAGVNAAM